VARLESEDQAVPSALELTFGASFEEDGVWRPYRLVLTSGGREEVLEDADVETRPIGRCALGLAPRDEIALLAAGLREVLGGERKCLKFEPQEPNWSLDVAASPGGWTVVCWIDAGNQIADHYTWDALGIRFFTDSARILAFAEALDAEGAVK